MGVRGALVYQLFGEDLSDKVTLELKARSDRPRGYLGEVCSRQREEHMQRSWGKCADLFKEEQGGLVPKLQQARQGEG